MNLALAILLAVFAQNPGAPAPAGAAPAPDDADQAAIRQAADWIHDATVDTEYDFVMTCRVRLLVFWAGKDDVGGGYVRVGESKGPVRQQTFGVLFGSDPVKAPRNINRWGAGTEVVRDAEAGQPPSSAFFGFMKSSKGESVGAMQQELSKESKAGSHVFDGILSRVDPNRAVSATVTFDSNKDFTVNDYDEADREAIAQLQGPQAHKLRQLDGPQMQCSRTNGFLSTTRQLLDQAVAGAYAPVTLCYVYNAHRYTETLLKSNDVPERKVHITLHEKGKSIDQTYRKLKEAHLEVVNHETGAKSPFDVLVGTEGDLRGVPIQINYQPNWWFQIVLNRVPPGRL